MALAKLAPRLCQAAVQVSAALLTWENWPKHRLGLGHYKRTASSGSFSAESGTHAQMLVTRVRPRKKKEEARNKFIDKNGGKFVTTPVLHVA